RLRDRHAGRRLGRDGPVHKARLRIEVMEESGFDRRYLALVSDRVFPDIGDLPHVDLAVRDHVGTRGSQMTADALPDSLDGLPDIDGHVIKIGENIDADGAGQLADRLSSE